MAAGMVHTLHVLGRALLEWETAQTRLHHSSIEGLRKNLASFPSMLEKLMSAGKTSRKMTLGLGEVLEKDNLQHFHFSLSFISLQAWVPHLQLWVGLDTDPPSAFRNPIPKVRASCCVWGTGTASIRKLQWSRSALQGMVEYFSLRQ